MSTNQTHSVDRIVQEVADEANELRIKAHGLLLQAAMLDHDRTGDEAYRREAQFCMNVMKACILGRSSEQKAAMSAQINRGL
ncbi:hypothetical protein [Comamonas sp.]|uniref:hypothetical protein n=1 Tax=Comamonas sp. TaxID=34028 RepID=UPI0028992A43|nr:hypothetical protein [Comamonas sp.]